MKRECLSGTQEEWLKRKKDADIEEQKQQNKLIMIDKRHCTAAASRKIGKKRKPYLVGKRREHIETKKAKAYTN